jgi:hypothetical protein
VINETDEYVTEIAGAQARTIARGSQGQNDGQKPSDFLSSED